MLTELTIKEFINKVLSNDPVPGGGSVSALNGALATSLAAMVANLTIGRKKYVEVNEIMEDLSVRFEELTRQLITDIRMLILCVPDTRPVRSRKRTIGSRCRSRKWISILIWCRIRSGNNKSVMIPYTSCSF